MALTDKDKIDLIVKRPGSEAYDLIAFDDGTETDEIRRYNLVIEKLGMYLHYVRPGQFEEGYPQAKGKEARLVVICLRPPNDAMKQLEAIKDPADTTWRLPVAVLEQAQYIQKPTQVVEAMVEVVVRKEPNKAPEPTPGIARSSQGSEVFNIVAGVAHL